MALDAIENGSSWDFQVRCESCSEIIELSVIAAMPGLAVAKQFLNEMLVDFGWLPTALGGYCREHAAQIRHIAMESLPSPLPDPSRSGSEAAR